MPRGARGHLSAGKHGRESQVVGGTCDNGRRQREAEDDLVRSAPFAEAGLFCSPLRQQLAGEEQDREEGAEGTQAKQPVVTPQPENN